MIADASHSRLGHGVLIERAYQLLLGARRRLRRIWLQCRGVQIQGPCWIQCIEIPRNPHDVLLGQGVALDNHVVLLSTGEYTGQPRIVIGPGTYVNRFTVIDASIRIEIGSDCMIGPHCYLTDHDHGTGSEGIISSQPLISKPVKIGNDVWIGAGATILKGVRIGDRAIIGAGAVVTKDVLAGSMVVGVPANVVATRNAKSIP